MNSTRDDKLVNKKNAAVKCRYVLCYQSESLRNDIYEFAGSLEEATVGGDINFLHQLVIAEPNLVLSAIDLNRKEEGRRNLTSKS